MEFKTLLVAFMKKRVMITSSSVHVNTKYLKKSEKGENPDCVTAMVLEREEML